MKVLVFARADHGKRSDRRFHLPPPGFTAEMVGLDVEEQEHLDRVLPRHDLGSYDRVVLDLKWEYIRPQAAIIREIPNLVIHEFDTWLNFYPPASNYGRFEQFYCRIPRFRLICTSFRHARSFRARGFDARCVPKSYDPGTLCNLNLPRPIQYGFIGSRQSRIYRDRSRMLHWFQEGIGLHIDTTVSRSEYRERMNSIRIFVSADVGMHEYMAKNFEAMGCGCMLLAYRQGMEEEELGFEDMRNVALYGSFEEAMEKCRYLEANPALIEQIAAAGQRLVEERYTSSARDRRLYEALEQPLEPVCERKTASYALLRLRSLPARLVARAEEMFQARYGEECSAG